MSDTPLPAEEWARVEIFGHRQHVGRIAEVERFGAKMLRIDVPTHDPAVFATHFYGGSSIFSITPTTEEAAREWVERYTPRPITPVPRLPGGEIEGADQGGEDRGIPF